MKHDAVTALIEFHREHAVSMDKPMADAAEKQLNEILAMLDTVDQERIIAEVFLHRIDRESEDQGSNARRAMHDLATTLSLIHTYLGTLDNEHIEPFVLVSSAAARKLNEAFGAIEELRNLYPRELDKLAELGCAAQKEYDSSSVNHP
jgi:hypothetical protein